MEKILKHKKKYFLDKKKKHKKKSQKQLELQFQLKEFQKIQKGIFSDQPILSIREYQKKKKYQKNHSRFKKKSK